MLDPKIGEITFNQQSQGYFPDVDKDHWVRAAMPHLMMRAKGPLTDAYATAPNIGHLVWDPGFYLDILFDALALRLSAAVIIEPLHRSTGYDRGDLVEIYKRLGTFISAWENAFLQSNIDGAIDPMDLWHDRIGMGPFGVDLNSVLGRRMWSADGGPSAYIALGAADPVTGVSSIDFRRCRASRP